MASTSSDIEVLQRSVQTVSEMLDRVLAYVRSVIAGETKGDPAIGRFLLDTFATSTEGLDQGSFASSLQVCQTATLVFRSEADQMLGYLDDIVPSKPCTRSSRSIGALATCHCLIA